MNAEIIAVGSEILLGDIQNTHAQYLSHQLAPLGVNVLRHTAVGDNKKRLTDAVTGALSRCDTLIITGGLGPTQDDLTRDVVAKTLHVPLVLDCDLLAGIRAYFDRLGGDMPESNKRQAYRPQSSVVLPNANGTAPGLLLKKDGKRVFLLPGPPGELKPMFEASVRPYFERLLGETIVSHNVHLFGLGESKVDEMLGDLMAGENPTVGVYAKDGEVRVRVTAKGKTQEACEASMRPILEEMKKTFKKHIYGIDIGTLENALVQKALSLHKTVALAESCTGGMVAQRITSIPGASGCFAYGIVSYANRIKAEELGVSKSDLETFGAVSEQVAEQMAKNARQKGRADVGIGITGIAGPDGGTKEKPVGLVYIGVSTKEKTRVKRCNFSRGLANERGAIRNRACLQALYLALLALDKA